MLASRSETRLADSSCAMTYEKDTEDQHAPQGPPKPRPGSPRYNVIDGPTLTSREENRCFILGYQRRIVVCVG